MKYKRILVLMVVAVFAGGIGFAFGYEARRLNYTSRIVKIHKTFH